MEFELRVLQALNGLRSGLISSAQVDSTRVLRGEDDCVVMVSYHLDSQPSSGVQFTFPFVESISMEENVAAFLDYTARSSRIAEFAPGEVPPELTTSSRSAGAD